MNKRFAIATAALMLFAAGAARAQAQDAAKSGEVKDPFGRVVTPLKIQVVFSEYDGEKKIGSLPYTLNHNAELPAPSAGTRTSLRMGIKVPVFGKDGQVVYLDVGTDIDCVVKILPSGIFQLRLELRRSSLYAAGPDARQTDWKPGDSSTPSNPFLREFRGSFDLLLKDSQTGQTTMATDPVSGRVLKVDVTLTIVK